MGLIDTYPYDPEYEILGVGIVNQWCLMMMPIKYSININFDPCWNLFLFSLVYRKNGYGYPGWRTRYFETVEYLLLQYAEKPIV